MREARMGGGNRTGIKPGGAVTKTNKTAPRFRARGSLPQTRSIKHQRNRTGGPNGSRTRVSALRGPCPGPLDDGAANNARAPHEHRASGWLGEEDSNPRYVVQSHVSY